MSAGSIATETRHARRRPHAAGIRARQRHRRSPLSADESRRLLADLQRPRDGRRKAAVATAGRRPAPTRCRGRPGCRPPAGPPPPAPQVSTVRPAGTFAPPSRSAAIPTISPTRAAGCRTIARTCCGSWAASTCRGPASWSPPICSTSAASRGRRRRRSPLPQNGASASCSSRAARGGCRRKRCSICACRGRSPRRCRPRRAAAGRAQCAERHRGGGHRDATICSARTSASPPCSSIRAARWSG